MYTFLSYGYALHAREGIKTSESTKDLCEDFHQPQEHEAQQFRAYQELEELVSQPEKWDEPEIKEPLKTWFKASSAVVLRLRD